MAGDFGYTVDRLLARIGEDQRRLRRRPSLTT